MVETVLEIHHLDVDKGDCTLFVVRQRTTAADWTVIDNLLLDSGETNGVQIIAQMKKLSAFVTKGAKQTINNIITSHYHEDHTKGYNNLSEHITSDTTFFDIGGYGGAPLNKNIIAKITPTHKLNELYNSGFTKRHINTGGKNIFDAKEKTIQFLSDTPIDDSGDADEFGTQPSLRIGDCVDFFCYAGNGLIWMKKPAPSNKGFFVSLHPRKDRNHVTDPNEFSIAFLIKFENFLYFTSGDLTGTNALQAAYSVKNGHGKVDIAKANHHGSLNNNPRELYQILKPDAVVIMANRDFKLPVLDGLKEIVSGAGRVPVFISNTYAYMNTDNPITEFSESELDKMSARTSPTDIIDHNDIFFNKYTNITKVKDNGLYSNVGKSDAGGAPNGATTVSIYISKSEKSALDAHDIAYKNPTKHKTKTNKDNYWIMNSQSFEKTSSDALSSAIRNVTPIANVIFDNELCAKNIVGNDTKKITLIKGMYCEEPSGILAPSASGFFSAKKDEIREVHDSMCDTIIKTYKKFHALLTKRKNKRKRSGAKGTKSAPTQPEITKAIPVKYTPPSNIEEEKKEEPLITKEDLDSLLPFPDRISARKLKRLVEKATKYDILPTDMEGLNNTAFDFAFMNLLGLRGSRKGASLLELSGRFAPPAKAARPPGAATAVRKGKGGKSKRPGRP